ncbi:MAG TPA: hypothetical protein VGG37_04065, partial [Opitutaceae bacterium]
PLSAGLAASVLLLLSTSCSRQAPAPAPAPAEAGSVPNAAVTVVKPAPQAHPPAPGSPVPDQNFASWAEIRDDTFSQKAAFLGGAAGLRSQVATEVSELRAKRSAMPPATDTKDWDFAMKEMMDSQQYLDSVISEAGGATSDTWEQEKQKVGQAWERTQAAYDKVKTSVTS